MAEVRTASEVNAEAIEKAPEPDTALKVTLLGREFVARSHRPVGAFAVMCARIKSSDPAAQAAAPIKLLESWLDPSEHERLLDVLAEVDDMESFMSKDFATAIEALAERPSPGL